MLPATPRKFLRRLLNALGFRVVRLATSVYRSPAEIETAARLSREESWYADRGDLTRRLDYDLSPTALVFDVGGYEGAFASDIVCRFGCKLEIFEPIPAFADQLQQRFLANPMVRIHRYGLAGSNEMVRMTLEEGGSSSVIVGEVPPTELVVMRDVASVMEEVAPGTVDLLKVNIEGGEYDLMDRILDAEIIRRFRHVQIQFHPHAPDATQRMERIVAGLERTHDLKWRYPWVWESWTLREEDTTSQRGSGN